MKTGNKIVLVWKSRFLTPKRPFLVYFNRPIEESNLNSLQWTFLSFATGEIFLLYLVHQIQQPILFLQILNFITIFFLFWSTQNKQTQFHKKIVDSLLQKIRKTIWWIRYRLVIENEHIHFLEKKSEFVDSWLVVPSDEQDIGSEIYSIFIMLNIWTQKSISYEDLQKLRNFDFKCIKKHPWERFSSISFEMIERFENI